MLKPSVRMPLAAVLVGLTAAGLALASDPEKTEAPDSSAAIVETIDVSPVAPESVRVAVERGDLGQALKLVRRRLTSQLDDEEAAVLRLLEARLLIADGDFFAGKLSYRRLLKDPFVGETARAELHALHVGRGEFAAAAALTDVEGEGPRDEAATLRLRAYAAITRGEYGETLRLVSSPLLLEDTAAAVMRGNAQLVLADLRAAEQAFVDVLERESDRELRQAAHFGLAQVARRQGARAVRALEDERAVRLGPAMWAQLDWGLALRALGRRDESREKLEVVVRSAPELAGTARLVLARLDEELGRVDEALEHLVSGLEGSFADFLALTRLGDLLSQEGRQEAAIDAYREALAIFPGFPRAREALGRLLTMQGRWEEASLVQRPDRSWELPGWTWERLLDGDLPFYEIAADRNSIPAEDPRRLVIALVHQRGGSAPAALGWTEELGGDHPELLEIRAEALERVGRTGDARELLEDLLRRQVASATAKERLARLVHDDDPDRAWEIWTELLTTSATAARLRMRVAFVLEEAGELASAVDQARAARDGGWLSAGEKRRLRILIEDLEDMLREREEETQTSAGRDR